MKTIIKSFIVITFLLNACTYPILNKNEYKVMDTLGISRNGFGKIMGYDVIIKYDSAYHYGCLNRKGDLTYLNPRNLKIVKK
jgi:hypothetical protein